MHSGVQLLAQELPQERSLPDSTCRVPLPPSLALWLLLPAWDPDTSLTHLDDQGLRGGTPGPQPLGNQLPLSAAFILQDRAGCRQRPSRLNCPAPVEVVLPASIPHG